MLGFDNLEYASETHVGVRRSHNQDNKAVVLSGDPEQWQIQGHLFLVADGMGAHAVGEKASELAAHTIPHTYHKHAQQGPVAGLRKAFVEANASIHSRGQQNREFEGMGTTGTALLIRPEGAWVGHVGDSRAYRIRNGVIEQLTFDHSLVWVYARQQRIDPERVENIPHNVIVRSLGPEPLVQVDIEGPHPLQQGDIFLLCSDGLSGQVSDSEIGAIATALPPADACRFLIDLANLRGGPDNITVVIARLGRSTDGDDDVPAARSSLGKKPLLARIPWPFLMLGLAIVLGAAAAGAVAAKVPFAAIIAVALAGVVLTAGIIGLVTQARNQKEQPEESHERPPPKVYRQSPCRVERPLLDKIARAVQALKQRAEEREWQPDWNGYQQHEQRAAKHLNEGHLVQAFQEYCRAMRPLVEAMLKNKGKDEGTGGVWDKNGA